MTNPPTAGLPENAPKIEPAKHPLRCGIKGDTHTIAELKKLVDATDAPDTLKTFINEELDKVPVAAATVDLHVVDHPNGSVSVNLHIKPLKLGSNG